MPYPTGHRDHVRSRIVESARRLFNRNGFESVSVDSIMAEAGLTRGAFYAYFENKSDLYAEILGASLPIRIGRAGGKGSTSTLRRPRPVRRSFAPTCRNSILTMWRIHVRWWRYPATLRAAIQRSRRRSRMCSGQW